MIDALQKELTETKEALADRLDALQIKYEESLSINEVLRKTNAALSSTRRDIKNFQLLSFYS